MNSANMKGILVLMIASPQILECGDSSMGQLLSQESGEYEGFSRDSSLQQHGKLPIPQQDLEATHC